MWLKKHSIHLSCFKSLAGLIPCLLLLFTVVPLLLAGQQLLSWEFKHPKTGKWLAFGQKGSVQEALIALGELPDPFVGTNEEQFGWIEKHDWEFRSNFSLTAAEFQSGKIDLELPNVDTYAKIFLNDQLIGSTENSFITYRFAIKQLVRQGENTLKILFTSPVNYQKKRMKEMGTVLPCPNDVGDTKIASLCRKPQYQFGWDWSMRMVTIGFWNPAKIVLYKSNRAINRSVEAITVSDDKARMDLRIVLRYPVSDSLVWTSDLFGTRNVKGEGEVLRRIEVLNNPQLWWPRGQGEQHLYADHWVLKTKNGEVVYDSDLRFGVRTTDLIIEPDQWGTSYTVQVNGRAIFCKGANYIPQSLFPASVSDSSIKAMVQLMSTSNFNMVRVWGGGYYQPDAFYDACDELGIMVWQDFMFACAMYPGTEDFLKNVAQEFDQHIPRLISHPSVVLLNGNNEVDVAWKNWGFKSQYNLSEKECKLIESYYDKLFKQTMPFYVSKWSNMPFVHTSPLSNWGKDEYFNHGSMHYWGVWHGKDPIEDFGRKTGRFNAEYGFQSFPEYSTLKSFSEEKDWLLDSKVMKHHQKSYVGNGMIAKHSDILYGKTSDFERFVYYSQLTQAQAVSMAISGHRTNMPRCSGTIYWQLNDCWPAPTWSSVDYFNNKKALQYLVAEDYRDVAVLAKVDTLNREKFFLVSDAPESFECTVNCKLFHTNGTMRHEWSIPLSVSNKGVYPILTKELSEIGKESYYLEFYWNLSNGDTIRRSFGKGGTFHVDELKSEIQPRPILEMTQVDPIQKTAILIVKNEKFVEKLWVSSKTFGVEFDRNFLDLLPGTHYIRIHYQQEPKLEDFKMIWL